jgi:hypothetical protein
VLATKLLGPMMWMVPRSIRPIAADTVASALLTATLAGVPGVQYLSSARMRTAS